MRWRRNGQRGRGRPWASLHPRVSIRRKYLILKADGIMATHRILAMIQAAKDEGL